MVIPDVRGLIAFILLAVIAVFTLRGCIFLWQIPDEDEAGRRIALGETLATICWLGLIVDVMFGRLHFPEPILAIVFWLSLLSKAASTIIKADWGYKVIRNTYRRFK